MAQKISLEEAEKRLKEKHGNTIEMSNYIRMNAVAHFRCTICDNEWDTFANSVIYMGTGCDKCDDIRCSNRIRKSNDQVNEEVNNCGCKWVGDEYIDCHTSIAIEFPCGHVYKRPLNTLKENSECPECKKIKTYANKRTSKEEIIDLVESSGFDFIGFIGEYRGYNSKIQYKCEKGHITDKTFPSFKKKQSCKICDKSNHKKLGPRNYPDPKRFSYDFVKGFIEDQNCQLLSSEYKGCDDLLDVKFDCGHTAKISFYSFKKGHRCDKCAHEKTIASITRNVDDVYKVLVDNKLTFLNFPDGYKNGNSKIIYSCDACGTINNRRVQYLFRDIKFFCKKCYRKSQSIAQRGSNSTNWQGGITPITFYVRRFIRDWQIESGKSNNFKCVITNKPMEVIHHLYPFNKILKETIKKYSIKLKDTIGEYTFEELDFIVEKFLEIHDSFGLGVPLTKAVHKKFHKLFGNRDFTPEQFEQFKQKIASGEIKID